ncbi:MAG: lipoate--protein ligase family protein [Anaerolineales bacterium]|nr:lipoate--protein ligase family protein [Anaerolineales bacterium]
MSTPPSPWRLILSPAAPGSDNMATDHALQEAVAEGTAPPTLRLYAWNPPCLSLGFAQPIAQLDRDRADSLGWDVVRRPTGGRAILHTDELTYSIVLPEGDPRVAGGVLESYQHLSLGIVAGLELLGLQPEVQPGIPLSQAERQQPVCFEAPSAYEISLQGRKVAGSAQVRRRQTVLQHGTIPLSGDITRICLGLRFDSDDARQGARDQLRSKAATLSDLLGRTVGWEEAAEALTRGMAMALRIDLKAASLSAGETERARALAEATYGSEAWTARV